jgi:hypothetical protein
LKIREIIERKPGSLTANDIIKILNEAEIRNDKIIQQLLDIAKDAEGKKVQKNIFVILGSYHILLKNILPENIEPITDIFFDKKDLTTIKFLQMLQNFGSDFFK